MPSTELARDSRAKNKDYTEAYNEATYHMSQYYLEANRDLEFYLGDQYDHAEREYLTNQRRNALVFNKVRKIVNLISGYQRAYRMAYRVAPRSPQGDMAASQLSNVMQHIMMEQGGYEMLSKAFVQGPLKTGLSLINIWHDFTDDPISGDLRLAYTPWSSFFIDPFWTRLDLQDCAYLGRRVWASREECKAIFPWDTEAIDHLPRVSRDSKFPYLAQSIDVFTKDLHRVDELWRLDHKRVRIIVDPESGRWHEWPEDAGEDRLKLMLEELPNLRVKEHTKRTVTLEMFLDDELMYEGPDPLRIDDYNFTPFVGYFDTEYHDWGKKMQGIIRALRDPAVEANRRRSKMLDLIDSQIHSGWIAEEDSVVNPDSLYQAGQGKVVWARRNRADRLTKIPPGDIPQGFFHIAQQMDQDIFDIGGINEDMLGQAVRGEERSNALLSNTRRYQGMLTLYELFDNYKESKRYLGHKLMRAIQENYTSHKVKEITGKEPDPSFSDGKFGQNAVHLDEVAITSTQRQLQFQQLFELKQGGAPIPWNYLLQTAPLENKEELMQQVQQAEKAQAEAQQLEVQKSQVEMQSEAAEVTKTESETALNRARAAGELVKSQTYADKVEQDRMLRLLDAAIRMEEAESEDEAERRQR